MHTIQSRVLGSNTWRLFASQFGADCLTETEMVATCCSDIVFAKHRRFPDEGIGVAINCLGAAVADLARDAVRINAGYFNPIGRRVDRYLNKAAWCQACGIDLGLCVALVWPESGKNVMT